MSQTDTTSKDFEDLPTEEKPLDLLDDDEVEGIHAKYDGAGYSKQAVEILERINNHNGTTHTAYRVRDLHTGDEFTAGPMFLRRPSLRDFEDTMYIYESRDPETGEWEVKAQGRMKPFVESAKNENESASGAGPSRIREETITVEQRPSPFDTSDDSDE